MIAAVISRVKRIRPTAVAVIVIETIRLLLALTMVVAVGRTIFREQSSALGGAMDPWILLALAIRVVDEGAGGWVVCRGLYKSNSSGKRWRPAIIHWLERELRQLTELINSSIRCNRNIVGIVGRWCRIKTGISIGVMVVERRHRRLGHGMDIFPVYTTSQYRTHFIVMHECIEKQRQRQQSNRRRRHLHQRSNDQRDLPLNRSAIAGRRIARGIRREERNENSSNSDSAIATADGADAEERRSNIIRSTLASKTHEYSTQHESSVAATESVYLESSRQLLERREKEWEKEKQGIRTATRRRSNSSKSWRYQSNSDVR